MKQNYSPTRLSKKQRHMKKWIPEGIYCHGMGRGKHSNSCPFWKNLYDGHIEGKTYNHKRSECTLADVCEDDCSTCDEPVTKCTFLNYIEYGQFPFWDMCKVCGIRDDYNWRE